MNRYNQTSNSVGTRYDGKRVFKTTSYPTIPLRSSDVYVIATEADFLDTLARKFYRDETLWWIIAQANHIKGTMKPTAGTQLRIPTEVESIVVNFQRANS